MLSLRSIGVDGGELGCKQDFFKKLLKAKFFFRTLVRDSSSSRGDGAAAFRGFWKLIFLVAPAVFFDIFDDRDIRGGYVQNLDAGGGDFEKL